MSYILKLAGWYPSRVDSFNGDFVQRQAQCISLYRKVVVLFLTKDPSLSPGQMEIQRSGHGDLTEYIVYYSGTGVFNKALSLWRYLSLAKKMTAQIIKEHGRPGLAHVNVVWKAGLIALYLKKTINLPYLITEHWTGYYKQDPTGLMSKNRVVRKIYRRVFRETELFIPVSSDLGRQVSGLFRNIRYEVVYNTVNTEFFNYQPSRDTAGVKRFIHVSTFGYQKNIEGLIRVIDRLTRVRSDFEWVMVGPCPEELKTALEEKGLLNNSVFLTGEISYPEVALQMQQSHIMVLFSRFENLPCVLPEGFCCGLPAVGTKVGGIPEIIDGKNGMLVEPGNEEELLNALHAMLDRYSLYDRRFIAGQAASVFSYQAIGKKFEDIYRRILPPGNEQLPGE